MNPAGGVPIVRLAVPTPTGVNVKLSEVSPALKTTGLTTVPIVVSELVTGTLIVPDPGLIDQLKKL
jgi:hypothetical protein